MLSSWLLLTRLGEAQILLPLVLAAAAWLWLGAGQGQLALRWLLCLGVAVALTTFTKLAFIGWEWGMAAWDFTGISGHAMFAAACLPMLASVALLNQSGRVRNIGVALAFALAGLIAYSRLPVQAHSASESLSGFVLGAAASLLSLYGLPEQRQRLPLWLPTALVAALIILPVSAPHSRSHDWVTALSLQLSGRDQPFQRQDLHHRQPGKPSSPSMQTAPAVGL